MVRAMAATDSFTRLRKVAADPSGTVGEMRAVCQDLMKAAEGLSPEELAIRASELCDITGVEDPERASLGALMLGALVEMGCPVHVVGAAVVGRTRKELELAVPHYEALCESDIGETALTADEEAQAVYGGGYTVRRDEAERHAQENPRGAAAYRAIETLYRPFVVMVTRDSNLRAQTRADRALLSAAEALRSDVASFLHKLLQGVACEQWVILCPAERRGFLVEVREIVDNFALQPLLANALVHENHGGFFGVGQKTVGPESGIPGRRPDPALIACLHGEGPQELGTGVEGWWNLYTHRAIDVTGKLIDDVPREDWVWNEGIPRDIPELDGHRLVVLGHSTYHRSWNANRLFFSLGSHIDLVRRLADDDFNRWLRACATR